MPTVLACIPSGDGKAPCIVIGGENGNVLVLDASGTPLRQDRLPDSPAKVLFLPEERAVAFGTQGGHVGVCRGF
ncbi:MAG: hypothetical protein ACOX5J_04075 [Candidatus Hydrogenedentales bacterium]